MRDPGRRQEKEQKREKEKLTGQDGEEMITGACGDKGRGDGYPNSLLIFAS